MKQVLKVSPEFLKQLFGGCICQDLSESRPGSFPELLCNPSPGQIKGNCFHEEAAFPSPSLFLLVGISTACRAALQDLH